MKTHIEKFALTPQQREHLFQIGVISIRPESPSDSLLTRRGTPRKRVYPIRRSNQAAPPPRKTNREGGAIWAIIRSLAVQRDTFTIRDLEPQLTHDQARDNCESLVRRGELKIVVRGIGGRYKNTPAVYARSEKSL